ncbi:MAG TPA: AMP-binding protein [Blastocatellia bacterium]|nr:AMP-binding protein [Blastocatellia bacterium]
MNEIIFYDREVETLDRDLLRSLQDERLRTLMAELKTNVFYKEKLQRAGLAIDDIRSAHDLRKLPFTTKSELVEEQKLNPPYGRLLTYPLSHYCYYHQTSGTTGSPLRCLDTKESWEWWLRCWEYVYRGAGVRETDTIFCAFSFGPYMSHWTAISGAWRTGAMCIAGGGMTSEQRLRAIIDNRCTVIVCTPTYALHLAEVARGVGIDLGSSAVRLGIHAGEPGASLPNVRRAIESEWGMTCFDHAGATEAGAWAFDCQAQTGAIHINEAEFIFEVIDPETLEEVSVGERGELVITNLGRAAMPVLRYRTGDLVEMTAEPCPCGRSFARIKGGVLGRADDMMIVRGVNIYPAAIDDLMRGLSGIVEYEVIIRRIAGMDDLLIKVESESARGFEEIEKAIHSAFRQQFSIRVSIERAEPGSLPRYEFKARRYKRENL